jgi:hypothetical protein
VFFRVFGDFLRRRAKQQFRIHLQAFVCQDCAGPRQGLFQEAKFGGLLGAENTQHSDPALKRQWQITHQSSGSAGMLRTIVRQ